VFSVTDVVSVSTPIAITRSVVIVGESPLSLTINANFGLGSELFSSRLIEIKEVECHAEERSDEASLAGRKSRQAWVETPRSLGVTHTSLKPIKSGSILARIHRAAHSVSQI
jgi:hypothetical protein